MHLEGFCVQWTNKWWDSLLSYSKQSPIVPNAGVPSNAAAESPIASAESPNATPEPSNTTTKSSNTITNPVEYPNDSVVKRMS